MAIFNRGRVYWYHFIFNGQHIQESTKQKNPRVARQIEAAHRTSLAKGEVGIRDKKPVPTFDTFVPTVMMEIRKNCTDHPRTAEFYQRRIQSGARFPTLG